MIRTLIAKVEWLIEHFILPLERNPHRIPVGECLSPSRDGKWRLRRTQCLPES